MTDFAMDPVYEAELKAWYEDYKITHKKELEEADAMWERRIAEYENRPPADPTVHYEGGKKWRFELASKKWVLPANSCTFQILTYYFPIKKKHDMLVVNLATLSRRFTKYHINRKTREIDATEIKRKRPAKKAAKKTKAVNQELQDARERIRRLEETVRQLTGLS